MAGVVLETISWKKLVIFGVFLFIAIMIFFVIGGVLAPNRTSALDLLATNCIDKTGTRGSDWFDPTISDSCSSIESLDEEIIYNGGISAEQVVFSILMPPKRDGKQLTFSRWQWSMVGSLQLDTLDSRDVPLAKDAKATFDARLGYRDNGDSNNWTELSVTQEQRTLRCQKQYDVDDEEGDTRYDCDVFPFYKLPGVHHDLYLLNFRLPVRPYEDINMKIGTLRSILLTVSYQNGNYTKLWLYIKSMLFPVMLMVVVWNRRRVCQLSRNSTLLERTLFALGIAISLLNIPVEWLVMVADISAMPLINDLRQTMFVGILLSFGIILIEEHLSEWPDGNILRNYWKRLFAIFTGCFLFGLFKVCERGVTLANAFGNIWMTDTGVKISLAVLITLGVSAVLYMLYLCYLSTRLLRYISVNESSKARRTYRVGLRCVLVATLLCVALTIAYLIMAELWEGQQTWVARSLHFDYTSAFWFGVYGIWNAYVLAVLSLFAPSQKPQRQCDEGEYGLVSETAENEVQT